MSRPLKVAIVEDNAGLRDLLLHRLKRSLRFKCLGAWADGESALKEIPPLKPDVILMDIALPGMSGIDCTRLLRRLHPRLNIIILTEHEHTDLIVEALRAGANGYLWREHTTGDQLETALQEVVAGGSPMTPEIARKVVRYFQKLEQPSALKKLTKREQQILGCLAKGWMYKEIAARLGINIETARSHLKNIYRKLQVGTRTEAVVKYLRGGRSHPKGG